MQNEEFNHPEDSEPLTKEPASSPSEIAPISPDNPPWNVLAAIGIWLLSVLFIVIFPIVFIVPFLISQKVDLSDRSALLQLVSTDKTAILLQLLAVIPAHILTVVVAWLAATRVSKYSFWQSFGKDWNGFRVWHAFAITIFFFVLAGVLRLFLPPQENEFDKLLNSSFAAVLLVAFFATFTAPLVEELVYRGILYSALQRKFGVSLAVVFVTVLFAAVHIPQYSSNNVPDYSAIIMLLLLSLVLTMIRVKTKNLLPCIVLHTVFNGIQAIILVASPFLQPVLEKYGQQPAGAPSFFFF